MDVIWKYIKGSNFFPDYCPKVKDWKKKMSGKNGRGNPVEFSETDLKQINAGLKKLFKKIV